MEKIHFYFFCLYNFLYKDGWEMQNYKNYYGRGPKFPEYRSILGLWFATWCWTVVIRLVISAFFGLKYGAVFWGILFEIVFCLVLYSVFYFYFIDNNRFIDIYAKYKQTDKELQRKTVRKVFYYLALPIVLIIPLLLLTKANMH